MALRIGPFAFFLRVIDDTEYATLLTRVLDTILDGATQIIPRGDGEIGVSASRRAVGAPVYELPYSDQRSGRETRTPPPVSSTSTCVR